MSSNAEQEEVSSQKSSPNGIQHMPRKRASGPGFNAVFDEKPAVVAGPSTPDMKIVEIRGHRYGPDFITYGCYAGAVAVAYTYANGFWHLFNKNRPGWANTFRHRVFILSPVMAMYACGNGVIPMPFKRHFEQLLGRQALSTIDVMGAKERLRTAAPAAATAE